MTLNVLGGEVTLGRKDVRVLTSLGKQDYDKLRSGGKAGYVYLRNNNRLRGIIVATRDDSITLEVASNRVIIPRSAIEQIRTTSTTTTKQVTFAEDDAADSEQEWLKRMIDKQLRKKTKATRKPVRFGEEGLSRPKPGK